MKLILSAVFALLAAPVFAADPATMTCKDMMAMDAKGMAEAGTAMKGAMMDDAKVAAMADADVTTAAGAACTAYPTGTVMGAMKASMVMPMGQVADPATVTCKDMLALGVDGMLAGGVSMRTALPDTDVKYKSMSDEELAGAAATACTAHPEALVKDAMTQM
jgi:hypothetical protein